MWRSSRAILVRTCETESCWRGRSVVAVCGLGSAMGASWSWGGAACPEGSSKPSSYLETMALVAPIGGHWPGATVSASAMGPSQKRQVDHALSVLPKHREHICSIFRCLGLLADCLARIHCCFRDTGLETDFLPVVSGLWLVEETKAYDEACEQPAQGPCRRCHHPHLRQCFQDMRVSGRMSQGKCVSHLVSWTSVKQGNERGETELATQPRFLAWAETAWAKILTLLTLIRFPLWESKMLKTLVMLIMSIILRWRAETPHKYWHY